MAVEKVANRTKYTYVNKGGLLKSRSDSAMLKHVFKNFTPLEWGHKTIPLQWALKFNFVLYDKRLMKEPELDDLIADHIFAAVFRFRRFSLCTQDARIRTEGYRLTPLTAASQLNLDHAVRELTSNEAPLLIRHKTLEVLNFALYVDRETGTDSFPKILRLLNDHLLKDIQECFSFVNSFWLRSHKGYMSDLRYIRDMDLVFDGKQCSGYFINYRKLNPKDFIMALDRYLFRYDVEPVKRARPNMKLLLWVIDNHMNQKQNAEKKGTGNGRASA